MSTWEETGVSLELNKHRYPLRSFGPQSATLINQAHESCARTKVLDNSTSVHNYLINGSTDANVREESFELTGLNNARHSSRSFGSPGATLINQAHESCARTKVLDNSTSVHNYLINGSTDANVREESFELTGLNNARHSSRSFGSPGATLINQAHESCARVKVLECSTPTPNYLNNNKEGFYESDRSVFCADLDRGSVTENRDESVMCEVRNESFGERFTTKIGKIGGRISRIIKGTKPPCHELRPAQSECSPTEKSKVLREKVRNMEGDGLVCVSLKDLRELLCEERISKIAGPTVLGGNPNSVNRIKDEIIRKKETSQLPTCDRRSAFRVISPRLDRSGFRNSEGGPISKNVVIMRNPTETLPKLSEFSTRRKYVTAFRYLSLGVPEIDKRRNLIAENVSTCPELLRELEYGRLRTSEEILEFLETNCLDVERALNRLSHFRWNNKDALEVVFGKIEDMVDQARQGWSEGERFRECMKLFWDAVDRPDWQVEMIRLGENIVNRVDFIRFLRRLEKLNNALARSTNSLISAGTFERKEDMNRAKTCYTCGKMGHLAVTCPGRDSPEFRRKMRDDKSGLTNKRWQPTCYVCNQVGHVSRECPHSRDYNKKNDSKEWKDVRFSGPSGNGQTH